MARKPETTFIQGIHRHLPTVYHEKMNNPFLSGTADVWYSGMHGDMWIEYKYVPELPVRANVVPDLSYNQLTWLLRRSYEGRSVFVVVGSPQGGVALHRPEWASGISVDEYRERLQTRQELAAWILSHTGVQSNVQPKLPPGSRRSSSRHLQDRNDRFGPGSSGS